MKLIDRIIEEVNNYIIKKRRYITEEIVENTIVPLFILKYLCDTHVYTYEEIVSLESINEKEIIICGDKVRFSIDTINKLLPLIQYENIYELVNEYINKKYRFGIDIFNNTEKKVCISYEYNNRCYDKYGNTTYITNNFCLFDKMITWFKFFDLVLDIHNEYITYEELDITKYNYLYINDFVPRYRFIKNSNDNFYGIIRKMINKNKELNIILHTDYKKISNINEGWYILDYLDKVILYDEVDTFLYFKNNDNDEVSIINYDGLKIKELDKLYEIINNNRRMKDVLTKTTIKNIKENHYRIGFRLYQNKLETDIRNINEIVDENTRLLSRLNNLNNDIAKEIDKLINR